MALAKNQLIIIAVVIAAIVIVSAAAIVLLNNGNSKDKSVVIEEGETITESQLADLKDAAKSDSNVKLTYNLSGYTVVFDAAAIQTITEVADISVTAKEASTLSDDAKAVIGTENVAAVYDLSYGNNTDFGTGSVTITADYTAEEGMDTDNMVVTYVSSTDTYETVNATYSNQKVSFSVSHFSTYVVSYAHTIKDASLKVWGNVDGDYLIDEDDVTELQSLVDKGVSANLYPIADANMDGVINAEDVEVVTKVTAGEATTIYHVNYHDTNGDGYMDVEMVSTAFPITSAITTGSANSFMLLYLLDIVDEIVGASYGSSNDKVLYGDYYLDTEHTAKIGSSSTTIKFEDGKDDGAADLIKKKNVTCAISDWNRTYLTNESDFETAHVDVVRVSAASVDPEVYTHSIMLLGTLFQKLDRAEEVLKAYNSVIETIADEISKLSDDQIKKAVASSMTGYVSSGGSDYTAFCEAAGAAFGLEGFDFAGSTSATVKDNLDIFDTRKYSFDNIVHIRTALTYASTTSEVAEYWSTYATAMADWEHAYDGQVLVSGVIPVPVRVAYIAHAIYGKDITALSKTWADDLHSKFTDFYKVDLGTVTHNDTLVLTSYNYTVTFDSTSVTVTDTDGNAVVSGTEFAYGTTLNVKPVEEKEGYIIRADGGTLAEDSTSFIVTGAVKVRYVDPEVIAALDEAASTLVANYDGDFFTDAVANAVDDGSITTYNMSYKGTAAEKTVYFKYYDTEDGAKAAYEALANAVLAKDKNVYDASAYVNAGRLDGIAINHTGSHGAADSKYGQYSYCTLYLAAYKDNMVLDMVTTYVSSYTFDADFYKTTDEECLAYYVAEVGELVAAIAQTYTPVEETA